MDASLEQTYCIYSNNSQIFQLILWVKFLWLTIAWLLLFTSRNIYPNQTNHDIYIADTCRAKPNTQMNGVKMEEVNELKYLGLIVYKHRSMDRYSQ